MHALYTVKTVAPLLFDDYREIGKDAAELRVRRLIDKGVIPILSRKPKGGILISRATVLKLMGQEFEE